MLPVELYVPAGQAAQALEDVAAAVALDVPAGQAVHELCPATLYVPAIHDTQVLELVALVAVL